MFFFVYTFYYEISNLILHFNIFTFNKLQRIIEFINFINNI